MELFEVRRIRTCRCNECIKRDHVWNGKLTHWKFNRLCLTPFLSDSNYCNAGVGFPACKTSHPLALRLTADAVASAVASVVVSGIEDLMADTYSSRGVHGGVALRPWEWPVDLHAVLWPGAGCMNSCRSDGFCVDSAEGRVGCGGRGGEFAVDR